ncbi:MAG: hypothetical protein ACSHWY_11835 [Octadecabacter sp.]
MFRWIAPFALIPTLAAADWSPRPLMFTYAATFDQCLANPSAPDLAATCYDLLGAAYVLKRAVAHAAVACGEEPFSTCMAPFEEEGLPATAARIAHDIGCESNDLTQLPDGIPVPTEHCVSLTADIMNDEGVVPLYTSIGCGIDWIECGELAQLNAAFWIDQVDLVAPADAVVNDLQMRNSDDCAAQARAGGGWATSLNAQICEANRAAALWADIVQHQDLEN